MYISKFLQLGISSLIFFTPTALAYDANSLKLDTVKIFGRAEGLIGKANSASEGIVGYADFENHPLSRSGELVEVIPGAVATQHSGEGKANQYYLRGFNLDHGTDFSVSVDGVPVNLRTHGHGQGYLDINFLIPELVEKVAYDKGPFNASNGDFSTAGSARYFTKYDLAQNFVKIGAGEHGYLRGLAAGSTHPTDNSTLFGALELQTYDGPWELEQNIKKINGLGKYVYQGFDTKYDLTASIYDNKWTATDQIPSRAVENGDVDRFGYIDPDLGGETHRYSIAGNMQIHHGLGSNTKLSAYAVDYSLSLFSNFTYFLDDPVNGDEFEQEDERTYYGASISHAHNLSDKWNVLAGLETRYDDIKKLGLYKTTARERLSTTRQDQVSEFSYAGWVKLQNDITPSLRASFGLRADGYNADVTALSLPQNSGTASDSILSPSLSFAWQAASNLEFYANYGQGFHSNDVRGATIQIDPATNETAQQVPILVKTDGVELGARYQISNFSTAISVFQLDVDSELVFVGDAGTTEPSDASTRTGMEANLFWQPNDWLTLDMSGAVTDANLDIDGPDNAIAGAVKNVFAAGALAEIDNFTLSARVRYLGEAPLNDDASISSKSTTLVNIGGWYDWKNMEFALELLNAFDAEDADITYLFESQLAGETSPVEDFHIHPAEPRQIRASISFLF